MFALAIAFGWVPEDMDSGILVAAAAVTPLGRVGGKERCFVAGDGTCARSFGQAYVRKSVRRAAWIGEDLPSSWLRIETISPHHGRSGK